MIPDNLVTIQGYKAGRPEGQKEDLLCRDFHLIKIPLLEKVDYIH
jgi:hypothetical protein